MLRTKFQGHRSNGSGEADFFYVFIIYGRCGHVGYVTHSILTTFSFLSGRTTTDITHPPEAFGSDELNRRIGFAVAAYHPPFAMLFRSSDAWFICSDVIGSSPSISVLGHGQQYLLC